MAKIGAHDSLDAACTRLHESVVRRWGRPCGLFFLVEGPRLLKSYAVWAADERRVLCYDGAGARFAESLLNGGLVHRACGSLPL